MKEGVLIEMVLDCLAFRQSDPEGTNVTPKHVSGCNEHKTLLRGTVSSKLHYGATWIHALQ